ncbi:membrane bound FAD containing D-sorbitol dehydrogenase [Swaminathania salitolerans LMG 21291]|uniref:Membrane bound FAD containing D-sorbitol dehydrogenase n=2 Tax=Swaminathania salitolerans TaxID=182838 RepID=A0A511BQ51_9PROT|nr:membrane bound FAD containing D-sorbitol dehydrogenase [Swaminathania salitolerans LMG 21291]GEL02467.1 hypothetical protein SSA02_16300 [Swaminathania salitolerans]
MGLGIYQMKRLTRRTVLACGVACLPAMALFRASHGSGRAQSVHHAALPPDFLALSQLLTGHDDLDTSIALRVWEALLGKDPEFSGRYERLARAVVARRLRDHAAYRASDLPRDALLHGTAVAIVGAWYLGRVGPMKPRSETDTPAFITYEGALMWRPTIDATVIPTYARGGPGFWAEPPATLQTD